tara:strand:+ start:4582 stop:4803 length:222 start_codon:yes stop_codon:yes gene_type:complete
MNQLIFNRNRSFALVLALISGVFGWYSTILFTNPFDSNKLPNPSKNQLYGLLFGIFIGLCIWFKKCLTIIPYI